MRLSFLGIARRNVGYYEAHPGYRSVQWRRCAESVGQDHYAYAIAL